MYYNANPKSKITGDCAFRAICVGLGDISWNEVVMEMAELSCKTGYAINDSKGIHKYLEKKGFVKQNQPRKSNNTKYTGKEFCDWLSINYPNGEIGNIIANIGGHHIVAILDGKVHDIWDSTYKCIGNVWVKVS
jgi:hypothetical protein